MPFDYTIRESARAKHVRFRVSVEEGLVVVVPKGFARSRIPGMIEQRKAWIRRALVEVAGLRNELVDSTERPDEIELPALDGTWWIDWQPGGRFRELSGRRLSVSPETDWRSSLKRWLAGKAKAELVPQTARLAQELGVRVDRITIRWQKTRWGSYSTQRAISLNAQLLFLPKELVRYVMLHELCHARHPNHSPAFWGELEQLEPDAKRLRAELKKAWRLIPYWLSAAASRSETVE